MKQTLETRKTKHLNRTKFQNFDSEINRIFERYSVNLKRSELNRVKRRKLIKILVKNEFNIWLKNKTKALTFLSKNPFNERERKKLLLELEPAKYETLLNIKKSILIENCKKDNQNLVVGHDHFGKKINKK